MTVLPRSLRRQLIAIMLLTTLVALVVALAAIVAWDLRAYHRSWTADMQTQAELLARSTAPAIAFDDAAVATENLGLLQLRPAVQAAAIYTARGELFAKYRRPDQADAFPPLPDGDGVRVEGANLVLYRRIVDSSGIVGTVYLRADYELVGRLIDYALISVGALAAAMAVALLMSARLQQVVTRPVLAMAEMARDVVSDRDFSRRADPGQRNELGLLAESLNAMLAEIERRTAALEAANTDLAREVDQRSQVEAEVLRLNAELEARVRDRTAQLEAANHELETFCYSVSHDLRAPLRSINGFSQALMDDFPAEVTADARRYLDRIRAASQRMGQLIEDLLALSNVSRGSLNRSAFDLGDVAKVVLQDLAQREPERQVETSVWSPMPVVADRRLVQAALENLLGNAWKFSAKSAAARIEVGVLRDGGNETFFVRDNGAGFDMQYADKLFSPFQRLHAVDEFTGTGIGLATVQRIVHRHGGRIWADARVGAGAVFHFTLPPSGD
jgi:signal transduction histidine kinase